MREAIPTEAFRCDVRTNSFSEADIDAHRERRPTPSDDTTRLFVTQAKGAGWHRMESRQQDRALVYGGDVQVFQEGFWQSINRLLQEHEFEESAAQRLRDEANKCMENLWHTFHAQVQHTDV